MQTSLIYHQNFLLLTLSIHSLFDQGDGKVAKETEVMPLGVNGLNISKDGGVVESYVSAEMNADIVTLSSYQVTSYQSHLFLIRAMETP